MPSRSSEDFDRRHGARDVGGASSSLPESREQDAPATAADRGTVWEFFNPLSEIEIRTGGNLPHWEQTSVWYFITFRLADALPRDVVEKIRLEREQWRRTHDLHNLSGDDLAEYHQLFSARYEQLLHAGSGSCVLRELLYADLVRGALRHFDGQRYVLDEHVVMPNHVHVLVKTLAGYGLANTLHAWKSYTAHQINRRFGRTGQLWQHESYDHMVRSESAMEAIRRYIRENPNVAGASSSRLAEREQDAPATPPTIRGNSAR